MVLLRVLGPLELQHPAGTDAIAVLRQPKRLALFTRLAVRPGTFVRRDVLLAAFWPELDDRRARDALNTALHFLRLSLGTDVLARRSQDEIGVNAARVTSDVQRFEAAAASGRHEEALAEFRGDFLAGFHVGDAAGFDEWSERERASIRTRAATAARELARVAVAKHDFSAAMRWCQFVTRLDPLDEPALRMLLEVQIAAGDHAGARRAYGEFEARVSRDLGITPAPETAGILRMMGTA